MPAPVIVLLLVLTGGEKNMGQSGREGEPVVHVLPGVLGALILVLRYPWTSI